MCALCCLLLHAVRQSARFKKTVKFVKSLLMTNSFQPLRETPHLSGKKPDFTLVPLHTT